MASDSFVVEAFTYLCISIAVISLRTFTRVRQVGFSGLCADDYFMLLVIIPYTTEATLGYLVGSQAHGLTNSGMTDEQRKSLSPDSDEYQWRVTGSKIQVAGWPMYASVLWCIKASLCTFYSRLTDGVHGYRIRILFGYGLLAATYATIIICYLASCHPIQKFWQIYPNPGNLCQPALSNVYILITLILNIVTDAYLIVIPVGMLWGTQLPMIKKLSLVVVFSGAVFVMAAGILRGILIFMNPIDGPRQGSAWAIRESFVAVVTACLPMIWGWLKVKLKPFLGSLLSSQSKKQGPEPGSIMLGDTNDGSAWRSTKGTANRSLSTRALQEEGERSSSDISFNGMLGGKPADKGGITKQVAISVSSTKVEDDLEQQGHRAVRTQTDIAHNKWS